MKDISRTAVVGVLMFILGVIYHDYETQDVMVFPAPSEVVITSAAPGELATLVGTVTKLRGECIIKPVDTDTILTDSSDNSFSINQRSGMKLNLPEGTHRITLQFEIPRLAVPGMALVKFDNRYDCQGIFEVRQVSPSYPLEILENVR